MIPLSLCLLCIFYQHLLNTWVCIPHWILYLLIFELNSPCSCSVGTRIHRLPLLVFFIPILAFILMSLWTGPSWYSNHFLYIDMIGFILQRILLVMVLHLLFILLVILKPDWFVTSVSSMPILIICSLNIVLLFSFPFNSQVFLQTGTPLWKWMMLWFNSLD